MKQLKAEAEQGAEFFILLNHGLQSSKDIVWDADAKKFHVFNHIDHRRDAQPPKSPLS